MKNYLKIIGLVAFSAILVISAYLSGNHGSVQGSIQTGESYYATSTGSFAVGTTTNIRIGQGILGSVVVSSTTAILGFELRDATSSTDVSSTSIAKFGTSPANGTYTYDVTLTRGLFLVFPAGFNGAYTVTYK